MQTTTAKAVAALLFVILSYAHQASGQHKIIIKDSASGNPLAGATIVSANQGIHLVTDESGTALIPPQHNKSEKVVRISMIGYAPLDIQRLSDTQQVYYLQQQRIVLEEVVIAGNSVHDKVHRVQMGEELVTALEARSLPAIMGEVDILKVLQLKPGVKNAGEGMAGFYTRGGGADQNLVRLDGIPIYNASHLLGLFSIFNNDAIEDARLYKSAFPAKYGGRLSSVLDVSSKAAPMDSTSVTGGLGLLSSRLAVSTPVEKGKSSLMFAARRTYFDMVTNIINDRHKNDPEYERIPTYYFSEFNMRFDLNVNANNRAWVSAYLGSDHFSSDANNFPVTFNWGNRGVSLNWRSQIDRNTILAATGFYSGYTYDLGNRLDFNDVQIGSSINTVGVNTTISKKIGLLRAHAGTEISKHTMNVGEYRYMSAGSNVQSGERTGGTELAVFAGMESDQERRVAVSGGIRFSGFHHGNGYYFNPEPRLTARLKAGDDGAFKASYTRMVQYLHLSTLGSVSLPVDIWYPSTQQTKPEHADQFSIGYARSIAGNMFLNIESYYKFMNNQVEFRDGANLIGNPKIESDFVYGKARAYGLETYLEKKTGRTRGWIGYTLAWASRQFDEINNGEPFRPRYDRRHDVSFVMMHKFNRIFSMSFNWIYGTGSYTTLPVGRYLFQNDAGVLPRSIVPVFVGRNNFQLQPVHRLDLSVVAAIPSRRFRQDITFSLYNVYNRRNPFYLQYKEITDKEGYVSSFLPKVVSLFPVLPGITYNFSFRK